MKMNKPADPLHKVAYVKIIWFFYYLIYFIKFIKIILQIEIWIKINIIKWVQNLFGLEYYMIGVLNF